MNDYNLHAALIGLPMSRLRLNTPSLVIDLTILERNIAAMAARTAAAGIGLRPHAKTHKSVDIAKLQIAEGAVGLCCAKIGEAEVLADAGISGLLITSPIAAAEAILRLATLATRTTGLMATVDNPDVAARIDAAFANAGTQLDVIIDVDPGICRTGVASIEAALALAERIRHLPQLALRGVQYYCGMQQHIENYETRRAAIVERTAYLQSVVKALREAGHHIDIISGSGTGTHDIDLELGVFTELQAGSYVFMDRQYLDCDLAGNGAQPFQSSLFVDSRVVSANHSGLVTIDAGFKSLSTDGGSATVVSGAPQESNFAFMGDEHAALVGPSIEQQLRPGDLVSLTVPHCDPTVNLYSTYHVVQGNILVAMWPVSARGCSR